MSAFRNASSCMRRADRPFLVAALVLAGSLAVRAATSPAFESHTIGDGLTDLLPQDNNGHGGTLRWYETREAGIAWTAHVIADKAPNGNPFAAGDFAAADIDNSGSLVGDITGNGRPDVAANGYWIENPGGDLSGEWTVRSIDARWHSQTGDWSRNATKVFCRDLAGDGTPDIFRQASHDAQQFEVWVNQPVPRQAAESGPERSLRPAQSGQSGPQPGDVFREYLWTHATGDAGGSLRVGGRFDYGGGPIILPHELDLEQATRAEIVVEKLLCHDGTRGLSISVNSNSWLELPEARGLPEPPWDYMHHTYPVVAVPLSQLQAGTGNQVRLRVSDEHPWNWPQNLIYGVHIRVYYDAASKPHPAGRLVSPAPGTALGTAAALEAEATSPNAPIRRVDFLGHFEDVNLQGDGAYTQWQYHFHRAVLTNHIGSARAAPWRLTWDTTWIPDQPAPFQLAARITDETGLTCLTEAVGDLTFQRGGLSVELCKPYDVPTRWLTRTGEHQQKFRVTGRLGNAVAAQLVWVSWSPGYMEGLYLNDRKVLDREGPRYAYYLHRVPVPDLTMLKPGENVLRTGKTPLYDGKMVHGMELNWPGIMVLIQYRR